jgi:hypothetical protein
VQAVMSAKEGPNAARRKLEQAAADKVQTGSFAVPERTPLGVVAPAAARRPGGLGGLLRRLFGKRDEVR